MSTQLSRYWEPIDFRSDFPPVYFGSDDRDHPARDPRGDFIVEPEAPYGLVSSLLFAFVIATAILFATMSFAFLEVETIVATLKLPHDHQVWSDLRRIENASTAVFAAVCLGCAVLAIGGRIYLSWKNTDPE